MMSFLSSLLLIISCCVISTTLCYDFTFNCPSLPPLNKLAQSVHELRPQDIKVVMALGDSVTAGLSMKGLVPSIETIYEFRGMSWCIGGDPNVSTIPGFLRTYTPDLIGYSLGSHIIEYCSSYFFIFCFPNQYRPEKDVLNAAQSGLNLPNLNNEGINYLLEQINKNTKIDMKNDWKLLTILAGFNDLCIACAGDIPYLTPDKFEENLRGVLEKVRIHIPRVFVNVVEVFNLSLIYELSMVSKYCTIFNGVIFPWECYCLYTSGSKGVKLRQKLNEYVVQYNERIRKVANDYRTYNEFVVVAQPGLRDATPAHIPFDFLSTFDCFHPSIKGHQAFAKVIWNNMLTPAANKSTTFDYEAPFICPTTDTLLYTN